MSASFVSGTWRRVKVCISIFRWAVLPPTREPRIRGMVKRHLLTRLPRIMVLVLSLIVTHLRRASYSAGWQFCRFSVEKDTTIQNMSVEDHVAWPNPCVG